MRITTCLLILLLALTGCTAQIPATVQKNNEPPEISLKQSPDLKRDAPAEITLTPVELFKGDAAKFKPFLGSMSGAFKLRYEGNRPTANLDIDIWKDGEKVSSACSIIDLFFQPENSKSKEIEIIVSIITVSIKGQDDFNEIKVSTIRDVGAGTVTCSTEWDKELSTKGLINMNRPYTFIAEDSVPVWGMQATSTHQIYTADFSPESLSKLEQAIILTLRFAD